MTESEWLHCTEPKQMVASVRDKTTERKLRLIAVACCRRIWHLLTDERSRQAVEAAENFADGLIGQPELIKANSAAYRVYEGTSPPESGFPNAALGMSRSSWEAAQGATITALEFTESGDAPRCAGYAIEQGDAAVSFLVEEGQQPTAMAGFLKRVAIDTERTAHIELIRDIFGNPFRPVVVDPSWLTSTVLALAEGIYQDRAFDRLPILADALQDAGCDNDDILNHCRQPGEHVRGCWVVDLLTGRK